MVLLSQLFFHGHSPSWQAEADSVSSLSALSDKSRLVFSDSHHCLICVYVRLWLSRSTADTTTDHRWASCFGGVCPVIKPNDNNGHVITTIFPVVAHCLGTAHVQDLFTELRQNNFFASTSMLFLTFVRTLIRSRVWAPTLQYSFHLLTFSSIISRELIDTSLQSMMNAIKGSGPAKKTVSTIPLNLYVSFKSGFLFRGSEEALSHCREKLTWNSHRSCGVSLGLSG